METPAGSATKEEGLRLLKAGQVSDAIAVLGKVISADPDDAQAHMLLGIACHQGGDSPRAAQQLEQSLRLQESAKGCYNLAQVYESSGKLDNAVHLYRRALVLDPSYATARDALTKLEARVPAPTVAPAPSQPTQVLTGPPPGSYPPQQQAPVGGPYAPPPYGGPVGPPPFLARQIEEQRKIREAHRTLIRSGVIYGAICGAGVLLLLNVLFAYVFSMISIKFAVVYLLTQVGIGAVYGLLIGLWIGCTAGNEISGLLAGAALGFIYGFASALIESGAIGVAVGVGIFCAILGAVGGLIIGWLVTNSVPEL